MAKVQMTPKMKAAAGGSSLIALMIAGTLALEGGYVNDPKDPGGETNMGVTIKVARERGYTGPMRQLPPEVAVSIHYRGYIVEPGYEPLIKLSAPVVEELYDSAINFGPARPSRWFQTSINELCGTKLTIDGKVGGQTIAAFSACQVKLGPTSLCVSMLDRLDTKQRTEYDRLVRVNSTLQRYYKGWTNNRVGNVPRSHCKVTYAQAA